MKGRRKGWKEHFGTVLRAHVSGDKSSKRNSLKDIFCFYSPWVSKEQFYSEKIKDWLGQEVGDGGTMRCKK